MQHIVRRPKHYYSFYRGIPPPLTEPENWFQFTDKNSRGYIDTHEVLFSLKASLRPKTWFENHTIGKKLQESPWPYVENRVTSHEFLNNQMYKILIKIEKEYKSMFDRRKTCIDPYRNESAAFEGLNPNDPIIEEYLVPSNTISTVAPTTNTQRNVTRNDYNSVNVSVLPNITTNPKKWFDYFDYKKTGILSKDDLLHGLITSTSLFTPSAFDEDEETQIRMYETIINIWDIYDPNSDGTIAKRDFLVNGGLADTLSSYVREHERNCARSCMNSGSSIYGSDSSTVIATNISSIERSMKKGGTIASIPNDANKKETIANMPKKDPPKLTKSTAEEFFNYLDTCNRKYLTKQQIIKGIFSLLNHIDLFSREDEENQIKQSIETIWSLFIPNHDNDMEQVITKTDFLCRDDHLCDSLIQFVHDWNDSKNH